MIRFIVLFILFLPGFLGAEVLFEDNFDSHSDWSPQQQNSASYNFEDPGADPVPDNWSDYRVGRSTLSSPPGNNTVNINSTQHRGASGKAFVFWGESTGAYLCDGLLGKYLGESGYDTLYIRFYILIPSGWQLDTTASCGQKFLHISHYDPNNATTMYDFFDDAQNKPRGIFQLDRYNSGASDVAWWYMMSRYNQTGDSPTEKDYFPPTGSYNGGGTDLGSPGMMGDGDWHCWEFRYTNNSASGVADGVFTFWLDGVQITSKTDIEWSVNADPSLRKWNRVWIGGNINNDYNNGVDAEQWYAIDDFVISTEYVGTTYVINAPVTEGSPVSIGMADGNPVSIGAADGSAVSIGN